MFSKIVNDGWFKSILLPHDHQRVNENQPLTFFKWLGTRYQHLDANRGNPHDLGNLHIMKTIITVTISQSKSSQGWAGVQNLRWDMFIEKDVCTFQKALPSWLTVTVFFVMEPIHQHHLQSHLQCGNDPTVANHNGILSTTHARKTVETPFTMRNRSDHDPRPIRDRSDHTRDRLAPVAPQR